MRQAGQYVVIAVEVYQLGEDVLIDLHRRIKLGESRVHIDRLVDSGGDQRTALFRRALRQRARQAEAGHHRLRNRDAANSRHRL